MGGAKSKPYISAAKTVLSKRELDPTIPKTVAHAQASLHDAPPSLENTPSPDASPELPSTAAATIARINRYVPEEQAFEPHIMREMSKLQTVTSYVDEAELKLRNAGEASASLVRHKEEASLLKQFGGITPKTVGGKLTEQQLLKLMRNVRDDPKEHSVEQLAMQHNLKEDVLRYALRHARHAVVTPQKDNSDLLIGR
jgi:uncharacterized membrane protein YccC